MNAIVARASQISAPDNSGSSAQFTPAQMFKLRKAAAEFESLLLANWWKSMKESGLPGGDDSTDPGHDTLDQLGIQAVCSAITSGRGLGIGAMLVRGLLSNASHRGAQQRQPEEQTPQSQAAAPPGGI